MSRLTALLVVTLTLCYIEVAELRASESNHNCTTQADCPYNAYCKKLRGNDDLGHCLCHDNAVSFEGKCLPEAKKLGDKCLKMIQCTKILGDEADCLNEECQCNLGSHFEEGTCHKFVKIGEECAQQKDCFSTSGNNRVSCEEGVCQCFEGYYANDDRSDCVLNIKLGEECTRPDDCIAPFSFCNTTCRCRNSFIPSSDKQRCLPLVHELGTACEEKAQCTENLNNTVCRNKICSCKIGTKVEDNKCVKGKGLGTYCDRDAMCTIDESECVDLCVCKNGWVSAADNKRCIKVADNFYATCEEVGQCTTAFGDSAECKEGHCVCRPGYFFSEMKCLQDKDLGSPCNSSVECHKKKHQNCQRMECSKKSSTCVCKQGYKELNSECSGVPHGGDGISCQAVLLIVLIVALIF